MAEVVSGVRRVGSGKVGAGFLGVPANRFASRPQGEVTEGCRLPVLRRNQDNEDEWRK